jgi:mannose-6-phosphate isomerase-like protein (cupin superfamily)
MKNPLNIITGVTGIAGVTRLIGTVGITGAVAVVVLGATRLVATPAASDGLPAATYKTEAELLGALSAGSATPDMLTSAVSNADRHRINVVRRTKGAGAIAHDGFAELHHIIEGSATLVTGGTIVRPATARGAGAAGVAGQPATIENGVRKRVSKGDVILIPAGLPHWYTDLDGRITYLEVRWEEK